MCALRWYVKSPYRHLFLEDISKHARVTKKMALPHLEHVNSKTPWATAPKLVLWLANTLNCDITRLNYFYREPPELWRLEEAGSQIFVVFGAVGSKVSHTHQHFTGCNKGGTIPKTNEIEKKICSCHNFFPLSSVQIIFIPACCLLCVL